MKNLQNILNSINESRQPNEKIAFEVFINIIFEKWCTYCKIQKGLNDFEIINCIHLNKVINIIEVFLQQEQTHAELYDSIVFSDDEFFELLATFITDDY